MITSDYPLCRGEMDKVKDHDRCHYEPKAVDRGRYGGTAYVYHKGHTFTFKGIEDNAVKWGCPVARECFRESYHKKQLEDLMT